MSVCLFVCLSLFVCLPLFVSLSVCQFVCLTVFVSIFLAINFKFPCQTLHISPVNILLRRYFCSHVHMFTWTHVHMFLFLHQSSNPVHGFWLYAPNIGIIGLFLLSTVYGPYSMDGIFDSIQASWDYLPLPERSSWMNCSFFSPTHFYLSSLVFSLFDGCFCTIFFFQSYLDAEWFFLLTIPLVWCCFQRLCLYFHLFIAKIAKFCAVTDVSTVFWIAADHTEVGKCNLSHFQIKQYRLQLIQSPLTRSAPRYALMMMFWSNCWPQNQN